MYIILSILFTVNVKNSQKKPPFRGPLRGEVVEQGRLPQSAVTTTQCHLCVEVRLTKTEVQ
jgi:hypothetical protein